MAATPADSRIAVSLEGQSSKLQRRVRPAAQYVPLLPRTSDIQSQQRDAPSSNARQRVRRACLECRTKKVKCDGAENCSRCVTCKINCEYVEFHPPAFRNTNPTDTSKVESLELRLDHMEQMFEQYFDQLQRIEDKLSSTPVSSGVLQVRQESINLDRSNHGQIHATLAPGASPNYEPSTGLAASPTSRSGGYLDLSIGDAGNHQAHTTDDPIDYTDICVSDPALENSIQAEPQSRRTGHDESGRRYADGYGELNVDSHGQLRYIGLGSTVSVAVENCIGLRRYITRGLRRRGFETEESFFTSLDATQFHEPINTLVPQSTAIFDLPPKELVDVLICTYIKDLEHVFPITTGDEVRLNYQRLTSQDAWDPGHAAVLYALLAVSMPLIAAEDVIFNTVGKRWASSGPIFYNRAMHYINMPSSRKMQRNGSRLDMVTSLGLLSVYLAETGSQAEAWMSLGRAIRIAQDIGLHRSPEKLRLPKDEWERRNYTWWCLYILERQLCTALGRPLSINEEDCDTDLPTCSDGSRDVDDAAFTSMIHLYRNIGDILKVVNSVRNANSWWDAAANGKKDELRLRVQNANDALHAWAKDMVPPHIKTAKSGKPLALKHVALSSFFSAVMLLHRAFIRNPHRQSPLAGSWAQLKSAKAATDCIRGAVEFFDCVAKTHFMVFHGQYVFVSALVLLSCARWSDDPKFVYQALRDVEEAMRILQRLEVSWKGANKCRGTVEEYLEFTFRVLRGDRSCDFGDGLGCQPQEKVVSIAAKRRADESAKDGTRKKSCLNGPTRQSPTSHDFPTSSVAFEASADIDVRRNQLSQGPQALSIPQAVSKEIDFFDNTINNFLSSMDSDMTIHYQLDSLLDMSFNTSEMTFPSPNHGQNSFF